MSWKEYSDQNSRIEDWLPWGGLVDPHILRNKDDGLFAVFEFMPQSATEAAVMMPSFGNGWALWVEKQHFTSDSDRFFLVLFWNPFIRSGEIVNLPEEALITQSNWEADDDNIIEAFLLVLNYVASHISRKMACHVLRDQELIDFLSDALTNGQQLPPAPDLPLYLDAMLCQDSGVVFRDNAIHIGKDKSLIILSLPAGTSTAEEMSDLIHKFRSLNYRHVQRLLLLSNKAAEKAMRHYTAKWCKDRSLVKDLILDGVLSNLNGYYSNQFIFLVDNVDLTARKDYVWAAVYNLQLPGIMEEYNLKDVWWGSLPGIPQAYFLNPPVCGFSSIEELFQQEYPELETGDNNV